MMSRKKEESDSGTLEMLEAPIANVLGIFPSLGPTHVDSEIQGEDRPRSRGPGGGSSAHNHIGATLAFSRVPAKLAPAGRGWRICRRQRGKEQIGLGTCLDYCSTGCELGQALVQVETGRLSREYVFNPYLVPGAQRLVIHHLI